MSNGSPLADELRDQDPQKPKRSALADSLREELHPGGTQGKPISLAEELRTELRKSGPKPEQPPPSLPEQMFNSLIVEPLKDAGSVLAMTAKSSWLTLRGKGNEMVQVGPREQRGMAILASFAGGPTLEAAPVVGPLLGKWGSFLTGEFIGGGIYGGIRPLEDEESRSSAMLGDAATFASFGIATKAAGAAVSWALKRRILQMPETPRRVALGAYKEGVDKAEANLASGGVMLDQLPPDAKAKIEEPILREAILAADPNAVNVDEIVNAQADKELETHARLTADKPSLKLPDRPVEDEFKTAVAKMKPMAGTTRGFEVTGPRATPPVPTEPTVTEILEGKGKKLDVSPGGTLKAPGTVDVMKQAIEAAGGRAALAKLVQAKATASGRRVDATLIEEVARNLVQETQGRAQLKEHIISPTVKGKSGKLYVGGATHPETMERAIEAGTPKEEFEVPDANRGFKTNLRDFATREEAASLVGHAEPLISEDVHKRGLLPFESEPVSELSLENTVKEAAKPGVKAPPEAILDAVTDHAVAAMKPADVSNSLVKADIQEIHRLPKRTAKQAEHLRETLTAALDQEGAAVEKSVLVGLTDPNPGEIDLDRKVAQTPHEQNLKRKTTKKPKADESLIQIGPEEQVYAPWKEPSVEGVTTIPKKLDGMEIVGRLGDKELETLSNVLKNEKGQLTASLLAKMTALGTGSVMEWEGLTDDRISPGGRAALVTVGAFLMGAAAYDRIVALSASKLEGRLARLQPMQRLVKNIVTAYNPSLFMNDFPKGKESFRRYVEMLMSWKQDAYEHGLVLDKAFPDEASNRAAAFVLDEGRSAPEFHSLTPAQQQTAEHLNMMYKQMGIVGKNAGILDAYRENYIRHLLPSDSFERWKTSGYRVLPTSGAFAKKRIYTLRELEQWAQTHNIPGPITKLSTVHAYHMGEFSRALAGVKLRDALDGVGLLMDAPKSAMTPLPEGWRPLRGILNLPDKVAPEPVAKALESIASPRSSRSEVVNALDSVKSLWMRSIMFWWWEHGFNVGRSWINLSINPADYANAYKFVRGVDGLDSQIARYGGNLHDRPDRAAFATERVRGLFDAVGLPKLGGKYAKFAEWEDKLLWDKVVPSLQRFSYAMNMYKWTERTGGKFLEGSPEFTAAARNAADFSNTIAGRVPHLLQEPELARGMRLVMFSPQWTTSRLSILANAAGEASEILNGHIANKDPLYLKFKMRQLGAGIVLTYLGSKLMSGKAPQFQPNSSKFYMRTGLHDANGKEIGLDVVGWWQDDVRLTNDPFGYFGSRLNPMLRLAGEQLTGRDYLGNKMTPGQRVSDILTSFGPLPEVAADAVRVGQAVTGGRPIHGAEALQMGTRAVATFRTSTLPRPIDAVVGRFAKKLLIKQGIPATDEDIYELSKLIRGNVLANRELIDGRVVNYLAYRRRGESIRHPAATAIWQEARRVLAEF